MSQVRPGECISILKIQYLMNLVTYMSQVRPGECISVLKIQTGGPHFSKLRSDKIFDGIGIFIVRRHNLDQVLIDQFAMRTKKLRCSFTWFLNDILIILATYVRRCWYLRYGSRGARMNLLFMYDHVPYYPTRPQFLNISERRAHPLINCGLNKITTVLFYK